MSSNPMVVMETSKGTVTIELWADRSPGTVRNFLAYVDEGFFDGLIFHRVIPGFMIQGGGFTQDMTQKSTKDNIKNEASQFAKNDRGTLAMARTPDPHSASSQFFINLSKNEFLDFKEPTQKGWGYCVFGKVIDGMDVVDVIAQVPTGHKGPHGDVPTEPVTITSIKRQ
ncbi:MAG: peptidylprolyl isomerase [Pseudomonadota bacterium]